jgi:S-methylmethionine-dependent homocysteine/selenocysteine methylase
MPSTIHPFLARLARPRPVLLDGPTGTELHRRGVDTSLPLWSARAIEEAPDILESIHRDYVEAGAEVLTACTFRTHERSLAAGGRAGLAAEWTRRAVEIARLAAAGRPAFVAGSLAPLEDCYSPELCPDDVDLEREHAAMARHLADAGVDLVLAETHNTVRESEAAACAAAATGLPFLVSFVCDADGRLLSGESVTDAARAVLPHRPAALLVNCAPTPDLERPLRELAEAAGNVPVGAYGNVGRAHPVHGWESTDAEDPDAYARYAGRWLDLGARLVGACCGTTPEHVRRLRRLLDERYGPLASA